MLYDARKWLGKYVRYYLGTSMGSRIKLGGILYLFREALKTRKVNK